MGLHTRTVEFPRHAMPLNVDVFNYILRPRNMEAMESAVTEIGAKFGNTNYSYGRGFVQIVAGDVVQNEMIYASNEFHIGLIKHMMKDMMATDDLKSPGLPWYRTKVVVTVCLEYFKDN